MRRIILISIILFTITACSSDKLNGLYQCKKGPYKSMDFDSGKVFIDTSIMKVQGTYEINGNNVTIQANGENLVLKSIDVDKLKVKASDFIILDSPMIGCISDEFVKKHPH